MSKRPQLVGIIDDDHSMLRSLQGLLEACGYPSIAFSSAEEFIERESYPEIDCLIIDIDLGGMSGIELRRRLKASGPELPVIFITALADEAIRQDAVRAGCVALLHKPFTARSLLDALERST